MACNPDPEATRAGSGGTAGACIGNVCGASGGGSGAVPPLGVPQAGSPWIVPGPAHGGQPEEPGCVKEEVRFERELPNVMLVIDGSSSMNIADFDGGARWDAVKEALIANDMGLVPRWQSQMRFGVTLYFSSPRQGEPDPGCPVLEQVPVALDNFENVVAAYEQGIPRGATPTGESLALVWPALAALDPQQFRGPRIIVLATDGEPTSCAGARLRDEGRALSKMSVTDAFVAGIRTYVIAVGGDVGDDHLRELANLGQGFAPDDPADRFYRVLDTPELANALTTIVGDVRDCVFALNGTVNEPSAPSGQVTLNGVALMHGDANGWHLVGPSQLALDGAACATVQSGAEIDLDIEFMCGTFIPR